MFLKLFASTWIEPKIYGSLKKKFKYLKVDEISIPMYFLLVY
jgi:hypothetical protein